MIGLEDGVDAGRQRLNHYSLVRILLYPFRVLPRRNKNHLNEKGRDFAKDRAS
jgi:hypothetical protein